MQAKIDTNFATTHDLAYESDAVCALFFKLFLLSVDKSGPINKKALSERDGVALEILITMKLVEITEEYITVIPALDQIASHKKRAEQNKRNAQIRHSFQPPAFDEVRDFIESNELDVDALDFYEYYDKKKWKSNGRLIRNWQPVVQHWHNNAQKQQQAEDSWN